MDHDDPAGLLRRVLRGNAIFSLLCGLAFLTLGRSLGVAFGISAAGLGWFGVVLVGFAAHVWLVARKHVVPRGEALYFVIADASYVVASIVVLLGFPHILSATGRLFFSIAAEIVAIFCALEYLGFRRLTLSMAARA